VSQRRIRPKYCGGVHTGTTELIICSHCDTVHRPIGLEKGQVAYCSCCEAVLARTGLLNVNVTLALAATAAILLLIANTTPALAIEFGGIHTQTNILASSFSLAGGWMSAPALVLGLTMFLVPLVQILVMLWLLAFASAGRRAPACRGALLLLHALRPWSMTEVFLLGVFVAMAKLSNWVDVTAGIGVWALSALTLVLTVLSLVDARSFWALADSPA